LWNLSEVCSSSVAVLAANPPMWSSAAADQRAAPAERRRAVPVAAALDHAEEERAVGPHQPLPGLAPVGEGIEVVEVERRLHEGDTAVAEVPERLDEKAARRRVIGREQRDRLGGRELQRVVEAAGAAARRVVPGDVPAAERARKAPYFGAVAVVQEPGLVRVLHVARREQGPPHHLDRLVHGGDEDIDGEPAREFERLAHREAPHGEEMQQRAEEQERFGGEDRDRETERLRVERAHPPGEVPQRCRDEGGDQQRARGAGALRRGAFRRRAFGVRRLAGPQRGRACLGRERLGRASERGGLPLFRAHPRSSALICDEGGETPSSFGAAPSDRCNACPGRE
jgi:hypothetical protein